MKNPLKRVTEPTPIHWEIIGDLAASICGVMAVHEFENNAAKWVTFWTIAALVVKTVSKMFNKKTIEE